MPWLPTFHVVPCFSRNRKEMVPPLWRCSLTPVPGYADDNSNSSQNRMGRSCLAIPALHGMSAATLAIRLYGRQRNDWVCRPCQLYWSYRGGNSCSSVVQRSGGDRKVAGLNQIPSSFSSFCFFFKVFKVFSQTALTIIKITKYVNNKKCLCSYNYQDNEICQQQQMFTVAKRNIHLYTCTYTHS